MACRLMLKKSYDRCLHAATARNRVNSSLAHALTLMNKIGRWNDENGLDRNLLRVWGFVPNNMKQQMSWWTVLGLGFCTRNNLGKCNLNVFLGTCVDHGHRRYLKECMIWEQWSMKLKFFANSSGHFLFLQKHKEETCVIFQTRISIIFSCLGSQPVMDGGPTTTPLRWCRGPAKGLFSLKEGWRRLCQRSRGSARARCKAQVRCNVWHCAMRCDDVWENTNSVLLSHASAWGQCVTMAVTWTTETTSWDEHADIMHMNEKNVCAAN